MKTPFFFSVVLAIAAGNAEPIAAADSKMTRDEMVHKDRDELENNENWIYNDLVKAKEIAREANKPLMIVFRCIP